MKNVLISAMLILAVNLSAQALANNTSPTHDYMSMKNGGASTSNIKEVKLADGVVTKIDKKSGKITLSHGPLPSGMPAMTMAYGVKDSTWLDKFKDGQKVRFALNDAMLITQIESVK